MCEFTKQNHYSFIPPTWEFHKQHVQLTSQPEPSPPGSVSAGLSGTPPSSTWSTGPARQHCHSNRSLSYTAVPIGPHGSPVAPNADSSCPLCLGKETGLTLWTEFAYPVCSTCCKTTGVGLHNVLCKDMQLVQNTSQTSTLLKTRQGVISIIWSSEQSWKWN